MTQANPGPRPGPRLSATKRSQILTALATRARYNRIAADVGCSRQTVSYYADLWSDEVDELRSKFDIEAAESSYESQKKRIALMSDLIDHLYEDELNSGKKLKYTVKEVGHGGVVVENERTNSPAVQLIRGLLSDIADETGERRGPPQSINMLSTIKGFSIFANPDMWDDDAPAPPQLPTTQETR